MSERLDRLIAAAKEHDRPNADATARAWASLEQAIGAGVGPSVPVTATTAGATTAFGIKGLVVVAVAVAMAGGAAIVVGRGTEEPRATTASAADELRDATVPDESTETPHTLDAPEPPTAIEPAAARVEAPAAAIAEAPSAASAEQPAIADAPSAAPASPRATTRRDRRRDASIEAAPAEPESTLAEQARLLGQAWRAVQSKDTARALAIVRDHAKRFPDSPLAPEREACRIVAWCEEGRPWAVDKARDFVATHAGTPATRVRTACLKKE